MLYSAPNRQSSRIRWALLLVVIFSFASLASAAQEAAPSQPRPIPAIKRALVVSIDGLRPDVLLRADTPRMHALCKAGSFSFWARTTALSTTLPSHTSMLTGVIPRRHQIEWNFDLPLKEPVYPRAQTLFEVARRAGYSTAMVAGKSKFVILEKPGTIDWADVAASETAGDSDVADRAVTLIHEHNPQLLFVHFPGVDNTGHADGWGTAKQLAAAAQADACLGRVLDAQKEEGTLDSTLVIVTADHGGAGRWHTPDDPRSRHIPWIAAGPGIRRNLDLTTFDKLTINTEDTFATVCHFLAIPYDPNIDGKPITQIEDKVELLQAGR